MTSDGCGQGKNAEEYSITPSAGIFDIQPGLDNPFAL